MKVTPRSLDFPLAMSDPHRGKGLHASDVYNSYYKQSDPDRYDNDGDPDLYFAIGLAWEQYFEKALLAQGVLCARPGELVGEWKGREVKFSPDLLIVNGDDRIGEIKATWKSSNITPDDKRFAKYLTQAKMYCYFTGIHRVRFFILHLVGDWRDKRSPVLKVWDIEFTKRELQEEMEAMMNHAESAGLFDSIHS